MVSHRKAFSPEFPIFQKNNWTKLFKMLSKKTNTDSNEFEDLDLSEFSSKDEQIEFLKRQDRIDTMFIT
jgi:hypothetical protein